MVVGESKESSPHCLFWGLKCWRGSSESFPSKENEMSQERVVKPFLRGFHPHPKRSPSVGQPQPCPSRPPQRRSSPMDAAVTPRAALRQDFEFLLPSHYFPKTRLFLFLENTSPSFRTVSSSHAVIKSGGWQTGDRFWDCTNFEV